MAILVVEDQPIDSKVVRTALSHEGFAVRVVADAEHAISEIQARTPFIIIMDLALPGMDGLSLTRILKEDPLTRCIGIIAVTAYTDRWHRRAAMNAGCDAYLVKPFGTRLLCAHVDDLAQKLI